MPYARVNPQGELNCHRHLASESQKESCYTLSESNSHYYRFSKWNRRF